jgi:hypothetical protein
VAYDYAERLANGVMERGNNSVKKLTIENTIIQFVYSNFKIILIRFFINREKKDLLSKHT